MLRNIFSNWALVVVQIAVLLYQTPVQVHALGLPGQDVWLTIAALTGTLVLLTLGLPMASVRFIAVHAARKEVDQTNAAIATCLAVSLGLAAAALGVSGGLWIFFERAYLHGATWQALSPAVRHQAAIAFWLAAGQVSFNFVAQLPYGILDAHDERDHDHTRDLPGRSADSLATTGTRPSGAKSTGSTVDSCPSCLPSLAWRSTQTENVVIRRQARASPSTAPSSSEAAPPNASTSTRTPRGRRWCSATSTSRRSSPAWPPGARSNEAPPAPASTWATSRARSCQSSS
jgi:hypothetical protein